MPKPPSFQRPLPVRRQKFGAVHYASPFGKPDRKGVKPLKADGSDAQLEAQLPRLPKLPLKR